MKYRMTFEIDDDCIDGMGTAELRALAIAHIMESEIDMNLTILNIEEVKE